MCGENVRCEIAVRKFGASVRCGSAVRKCGAKVRRESAVGLSGAKSAVFSYDLQLTCVCLYCELKLRLELRLVDSVSLVFYVVHGA